MTDEPQTPPPDETPPTETIFTSPSPFPPPPPSTVDTTPLLIPQQGGPPEDLPGGPPGGPPSGPPGGPPPPPPLPTGPTVPYRQLPHIQRNAGACWSAFQECRVKGLERLANIRSVQPEDRQPRAAELFGEYLTNTVVNADSPTGSALESKWRAQPGTDSDYGFKNTPVPTEGKLFSWQNKNTRGEPLTNTDIYFYQYVSAWRSANPDAPLPKLTLLQRQQAANEVTTNVLGYLSWLRDSADAPVGTYGPNSDEFAALLGTPNGTAPALLVIHYGDQLGISRILTIEVNKLQNFIFTYE